MLECERIGFYMLAGLLVAFVFASCSEGDFSGSCYKQNYKPANTKPVEQKKLVTPCEDLGLSPEQKRIQELQTTITQLNSTIANLQQDKTTPGLVLQNYLTNLEQQNKNNISEIRMLTQRLTKLEAEVKDHKRWHD